MKESTEIVTTFIGRKDMDSEEFNRRRWLALKKHGLKLRQMMLRPERISKYHFENQPTDYDVLGVETLRINHAILKGELTEEEIEEFEKILFTRYVAGTTAIEGNTYSLPETDKLLNSGLTTENKSMREAMEISNFNEVRLFINKYNGQVSEQLIKNIHSILMKGIKDTDGKPIRTGQYRTTIKGVYGVAFKLCPPESINQRMKYLIADFNSGLRDGIHPLELTCIFHQKFEEIHPFQDGNGRVGREVLNYMLRKIGLPGIYIPPEERNLYLSALEEGNKSNFVPLIDFILHRVLMSMLYWLTKTKMSETTLSEDFKEFYESFEGGKEEYKHFISVIENFDKAKRLP